MSNKNNGWPVITQIFQQAKPEPGGSIAGFLRYMFWGFVVLGVLKILSL